LSYYSSGNPDGPCFGQIHANLPLKKYLPIRNLFIDSTHNATSFSN